LEWLASTRIPDGKGGSVFSEEEDRYECYRVGTELATWEDVVVKKHQEEEIIHGKLL
jgi:hypothetical protein